MAIDPVCKMTVEEGSVESETVAGQTFFFCSEGCRAVFLRNPEGYLRPAHEGDETEA